VTPRQPAPLPRYPIRAVSRLTGLSVDTLRAWERRYQVVAPSRDSRGRLYTDNDVHRLQLLSAAVERGHAIGRLARLTDAQVEGLINAPAASDARAEAGARGHEVAIGALTGALERFDHLAVERELNRLAFVLSPHDFVHRVVVPVMKRVGDDWHAERLTIAQEHLISEALRNLLGGMIRLHAREQPPRRLLFATPAGDRHEFGILAGAMLAAAAGLGVLYLGPDLPAAQIIQMATRSRADVIVLGVVYADPVRDLRRQVEHVIEHLPAGLELWVCGKLPPEVERAVASPPTVRLADFTEFDTHVARLGGRF
jgi:MerR family transcriptional regulator, light-induced transcriptional regulator